MADTSTVNYLSYLLALSGWTKLIYDYIAAKAKIRGRIFGVIRGHIPNLVKEGDLMTAFLVYVYLTNLRKSPIHILDYALKVYVHGEWRLTKRVYGAHNIANPVFNAVGGGTIEIENFSGNLINRKNLPVDFGMPLHGWLMFVDEPWLHNADITQFMLTCTDVFANEHTIVAEKSSMPDLALLQDIAGIKLPKHAVIKGRT